MNKLLATAVAAAAVIAVLLVGPNFLPSSGSGPGGQPTASAEPSDAAPSAEPSDAAPSAEPTASPDAFLPVGPYTVVDHADPNAPLAITVDIPASGWTALPEFGGLEKGDNEGPNEAAILAWAFPAGTGFYVYEDPCKWTTTMPDTPVTTVDDFAAALAAQPSRDGSDPVDVTVGEYAGKLITLHVPNDAPSAATAFADCDQETFATYGTSPGNPNRTQQGPGQVDELWILDADGDIVVLNVMYRPDTSDALIAEMRTIVESATFEVP